MTAASRPRRLEAKGLLNAAHNVAVFGRRVRVLSAHLAALLPEQGRVLDLGSGDGSIAAAVMAHRPGLRFEGAEVMIRPTSRIPVTPYDGTTLPFADDSFDYVTIVDVLHHTGDAAAVLTEAARVARRGIVVKDHLLAGVWAGSTLRFMDWVGNRGHGVVLPYSYLTDEQWQAAFRQARLTEAAKRVRLGIYPPPFTWVFDRQLHFVVLLERAR